MQNRPIIIGVVVVLVGWKAVCLVTHFGQFPEWKIAMIEHDSTRTIKSHLTFEERIQD